MTHALDDIKQKTKQELTFVEICILDADEAENKNLAYRAADEYNGMKAELAQKDAVIEAARKYINSDDHMNVQRYENLVEALAALPLRSAVQPAPAPATEGK